MYPFLKRTLDLGVALVLLLLLAPVLAFTALLVRWKLGSPVLFRQERAGRLGHPFTIFKFRTMTEARDPEGHLLPDGDRLTPFGQFLRSSSLDELPQLLNVLKGDISLVGPRPLPTRYVPRYTPEQHRRLDCPPGITGWAQVNGRNMVNWDTRFGLDTWYVDNRSTALDLRILALTFWRVICRTGISQKGQATMTEFRGKSPATPQTNITPRRESA
ncbi:sugar transferase [Geothrix fuzhouensis]|uniref:sugar transferase n=1 Tax=Geothrix fuzhouensis TaxID=2966451 RepID=UPI002148BA97|nr:sugar transferase [Geothrix fuzhouensis]